MDSPIRLIAGLGNPGPEYQHTRHNAGADFVEALAHRYGVPLRHQARFFGATARLTLEGQDIHLLIPATYMNKSGQSVAAMARFFQVAPAEILVAHDELDLPPGISRLKIGGGHGGHNGLRDIVKALANDRGFARLRIGIGHPGHASEVVNYVLRRAPQAEQRQIEASIEGALDALPLAVKGAWNEAMTRLHTKPDEDPA
ncbi:MAG TPA: aminoacyl-tRNA hydrolase [Porticoccaceae bacterium]|nr:aminoacyl-tRNA hydrolase [Porticoccaceae bacterium]